ncbi:MAG: helix-turn-helix domain-containing protein [Candidatus Lokiarchaeia archaeon]
MHLGEKIRIKRESRNISLRQLASMVGPEVNKDTIQRIETDEKVAKRAPFEFTVKIAKILQVPLEYFITGINPYTEIIQEDYLRVVQNSGLSQEARDLLLSVDNIRLKEAILSLGPLIGSMRRYNPDLFRIKKIRSEKYIDNQGSVLQSWKIELEALRKGIFFYRHRYIRSIPFEQHLFHNFEIKDNKVSVLYKDSEVDITPLYSVKKPGFVYFVIPFKEELEKDKLVQISWEESYDNAHVMHKKGINLPDEFIDERTGYFVLYSPTELLEKEVIFPPNYEVSNIYPEVGRRRYEQRITIHEEIERIKRDKCFSVGKKDKRIRAKLYVKNPLPGVAYYIRWEIPE